MNKIIEVKDLAISLNGQNILSAVNFSLSSGEILGVVGPSGCGKTTLLNTIAGFIKQSDGSITIDQNLLTTASKHIVPEKRNIGMIFQNYALFPHLNVTDNISFGLQALSKEQKKVVVAQMLKLMGLTQLEQRFIHQLSGGQQQRVAIARAIAPKPKLLLLDEPFSNIDARLRNDLMIELRALLKKLNMSAIFVTHSKDEVFTFADKMAVLSAGKLQQIDSPTNICQAPKNWQVADFLQLGSWLPLTIVANEVHSGLGKVNYDPNQADFSQRVMLLIKPKHIKINDDDNMAANAIISHIGITEHGYHYLANSLTSDNALAFSQLSFHSDKAYHLAEQLSLSIVDHPLVVFEVDH